MVRRVPVVSTTFRTAKPANMRITSALPLLLLLAGSRAFAEGPNAVAIGVDATIPGDKNPAEFRSGVVARVMAGFDSFKLDLSAVSDPRIVEQARTCEGASCLQDLARSADLALVVQVRIQAKKAAKKGKLDYSISMLVARETPDRNSWREKVACSDCDASEAKQQVFLLAGTIGERIKSESPKTAPHPVAVALPTPPPVVPPVVAPNPVNPPPATDSSWSVPRYVSGSVLGAGLVAAGIGAYLVHLNGRGTCDVVAPKEQCPDRYKTTGLGYGLVAGGGVAAIGGLLGLLLLGPPADGAGLAVGFDGSSLSVSGAY
jgi:hypothetical protein